MKPHLLFLDIDGVINNRWSMRQKARGAFNGISFPSTLNHNSIKRCNRLVEEGQFDVVLCSTWGHWPLEAVSGYLQSRGCTFPLIGSAYGHFYMEDKKRWARRGDQIQRWLDEHQETRPFIILDDDCDMEHLRDRLIRTDHERGLRFGDVQRALQKIRGVLHGG